MRNTSSCRVPYRFRFVAIPNFPNYVMNRVGEVKNRTTQYILSPKDWRKGEARYNLTLENGGRVTMRTDQLFQLTFGCIPAVAYSC